MSHSSDGLGQTIDLLRCPVCGDHLDIENREVVCGRGHRADIARQGYVTLSRTGITHPGDTAPMVLARERVQSAGLLDQVADQVVAAVPDGARTTLDLGAGTGFYSARVLDYTPTRRGVAIDSSKAALRRAAGAHPRLGAVGADLTQPLPVGPDTIDCCLVVFAPRNVEEIQRVLSVDGSVVVVTPTPQHLEELIDVLGMLVVPAGKQEELLSRFGGRGVVRSRDRVVTTVQVTPSQAADLAMMGPAGFHQREHAILQRAGTALATSTSVTVSVDITRLVPS